MYCRIEEFIKLNTDEMLKAHKELCIIPAPSHYEEKRAEYCLNRLKSFGAVNVYIDEAKNVILPLNCEKSNDITVIAAHTDTVFPVEVPLEYSDDGRFIHCPGCADDTAGVAVLLYLAKFIIENNIKPENGLMIVLNSGEEGLGNLYGTRYLFDSFKGRINRFITIDSEINCIHNRCVASKRFEVEVKTKGGHSYGDFGNENAIKVLAEIIDKIYSVTVSEKDGTKTTFNVGEISGGTSVNTIAQNAKMLCEFRSDDLECYKIMEEKFDTIFKGAEKDGVAVNIKVVGERPCADIDLSKVDALADTAADVIEGIICEKVTRASASTDCNIPLSLGIPAVCMGVCKYYGMHTKEECLEKKSLITGLEIVIKTVLKLI